MPQTMHRTPSLTSAIALLDGAPREHEGTAARAKMFGRLDGGKCKGRPRHSGESRTALVSLCFAG